MEVDFVVTPIKGAELEFAAQRDDTKHIVAPDDITIFLENANLDHRPVIAVTDVDAVKHIPILRSLALKQKIDLIIPRITITSKFPNCNNGVTWWTRTDEALHRLTNKAAATWPAMAALHAKLDGVVELGGLVRIIKESFRPGWPAHVSYVEVLAKIVSVNAVQDGVYKQACCVNCAIFHLYEVFDQLLADFHEQKFDTDIDELFEQLPTGRGQHE